MLPNLIFVLASVFLLVMIGLLWLRHNLLQDLSQLSAAEQTLRKDLERERDKVPYLLEAMREGTQPTDAWFKLRADRSALLDSSTLPQELEFHENLGLFLLASPLKTINFLEAKKEIESLSRLILADQQQQSLRKEHFNAEQKKFPFNLASGIFGFHPIL